MEIINTRVDERLVHGMVATFWIPRLHVDRVICVDDKSAEDQLVKNALRMATPKEVRLSVISLDKMLANVKENKYGSEKVMIVAKNPSVIQSLLQHGVPISEVTFGNLGIIHKIDQSISVNNYLSVTEEDIASIEQLHSSGCKLTIQLIPDDIPTDFYHTMKEKIH